MSLAAIQDSEVTRLRRELAAAHGENRVLRATNANLAKTLAELTDDCPDWAPSLAIVYSFWAEAKRAEPSWRVAWTRIRPLISALGSLPAPLLSPFRWDSHRAERRMEVTKTGKPACDATLNLELLYAKQMLSWAVARGMIKRNPLSDAKPVKTLSQRETRLTPEDIDRLISAADDVVDRRKPAGDDDGRRSKLLTAFILACFDSLMRFNEARHLRHDRIRPDGLVTLLASETKSKRERVVRLTERTLEAIRALGSSGYVFTVDGKLVCESSLREWFRRAAELSGVDERATLRDKQVRPHDARAGAATSLDEAGARATAIRDALGHRDLATTERYLRSGLTNNARHIAAIMERIGPVRAAPKRKVNASQQKV